VGRRHGLARQPKTPVALPQNEMVGDLTPPKGRHIRTNGVRLHYLHFENKHPPLILIPGITMTAATWQFVAARLARFAQVFLIDPRGRGLSEGGAALGYLLDDYAADVLGMIDGLGLRRADVLGHSMGARIAIRLAARAPRAVANLVLADPPMTGPGRRAYPTPLSAFLDGIEQASQGLGREQMREMLGWPEEHIDLRMQWLPTCDPHAVAQSYRSFIEEDIHADLPKIAARTLLLYAGRGGTVTEADADEAMALLARGTRLRIDDAGHMIPWDDLDGFDAAVRGFLCDADAAASRA